MVSYVTLPTSTRSATLLVWQEKLRFPWWLGGVVGSTVAAPFVRRRWRKNVATLKAIVEGTHARTP